MLQQLVVASYFRSVNLVYRVKGCQDYFLLWRSVESLYNRWKWFCRQRCYPEIACGRTCVRTLVRPGSNLRMLEGLPIERITGDLSNRSILHDAMIDCQWVFHVAALYAYWGYSWEEFYRSNVEGTRNVLEATAQTGVERIVYTSSIASLGIHPAGRQVMKIHRLR